ncbi:MAG: hypothetical protein HOP11_12580 [Saprospiraceae bacterium]|nr:hypothetical protein [Saprospiraceae bacterium]
MNAKLKLGIFITLYLLSMIIVGIIWIRSIRLQDKLRPRQLIIKVFKPSVENLLIQEKDIHKYVQEFYKKDWRKIPLQSLKVSGLESALESIQVVHHSEVYFDALENLHIDVYQRDPLFRVMTPDGDQYYVDIEGKKIPASINYSARVPVVTGIETPFQGRDIWARSNSKFKDAFYVVNEISKDPFIKSLIEQLDIDSQGEITLVPKIGYEKIEMGNATEIFEKLDKLKFFYKEGLRYEGWNVYQTLNLKVKNQVVGVKNINQS